MLPKVKNQGPISKTPLITKLRSADHENLVCDEQNTHTTQLPDIRGSCRNSAPPKRDSINFQCNLLRQKNKKKELLGKRINASLLVEVKEEDDKQSGNSDEEVKRRRLKAEKTMDQIIRSIKHSFCRARPHSEYANPVENIVNVSNVASIEENPVDANSNREARDSTPNVADSEASQLNSVSESRQESNESPVENQDPNINDVKAVKGDETSFSPRFEAITEHIELPLSKEKVRVPFKRIIHLKSLPTDPLAKLRKEKRLFSVGFKVTEQTDSKKTLNDSEQIHLTALVRLCEAYTKNLGPDYLRAMAKESVIPLNSFELDEGKNSEWHEGTKIVEDPNERLWNWEKSLINSNLLRDYQGRPIFNKDLDIRHISDSPDIYRGSLGPNEYDAKSDLGALLMNDSDTSTDIEYDEIDFILGHSIHPFNDSVIIAGGMHPSRARDRYLNRRKAQKDTSQSTGGIISHINSIPDENQVVHTLDENTDEGIRNEPDSPLPLGAEAGNIFEAPKKTPTETTFTSVEPTSTSATSASLPGGGPKDRQKTSGTATTSLKSPTLQKHRRGTDTAQLKPQSRARFIRRARSDRRPRDPIEVPNDFPVDNLQAGFDKVAVDWCKIITASGAPNPMCWFDAMDAMENREIDKVSVGSEENLQRREAHGLGKRFISVAGGLEGLYTVLKHTVEPDQPKAEVLLDCMVKNYKLQMPLAVGDAVRLRELYENTIVKNPMLYKMVLLRRNILPEDLQVFVAKIIEITESSEAMLAALYPSKTNSEVIIGAAKEMFASGYLSGGPPCPSSRASTLKRMKMPDKLPDDENDNPACEEELVNTSTDVPSASTAFVAYGSEVNYDKAINIALSNPSRDILQDVAYHIPEFAYHTRPLFETKWIEIGQDRTCETMLPQLFELRNMRQRRLEMLKLGLILTEKEERDEAVRVRQLSYDLIERLCHLLTSFNTTTSSDVWMCLLACFHGLMFWPPLGDCLVNRLNIWIPALLLTLQSAYPTVREEGCCVLAFLACCYPLFCRLHTVCRNLLVSNMTFALLDAMERYPSSYACFHGTLGYILHSIPCNAVMDCLLIWVPDIIDRGSESPLARDWPLFIYYIAKHWPSFAIKWNLLYDRQVLKLIERGLTKPISKHNARLALGYLARRKGLLSSVFTVWRERENEV